MRAVERVRVRRARRAAVLSCGHRVAAGAAMISRNRGPWRCWDCGAAVLVRPEGQRPRTGPRSLTAVLADEGRYP